MRFTLSQLFGEGASQDSSSLTIPKNGGSTAEGYLVGILKRALDEFEGDLIAPDGETLVTPDGAHLKYSLHGVIENLDLFFWRCLYKDGYLIRQLVMRCYLPVDFDFDTEVDPDLI